MKIVFDEDELKYIDEFPNSDVYKHYGGLLPNDCEGQGFSLSFEVKDKTRAEYFIRQLLYSLSPEDIENIGLKFTAFSLYDYRERDRIIQKMQDTLNEMTGLHVDP